ncbi:MAG: tyrosine-type recombinase/integrase, partial [Pseudonocardiaceae bacterium]
MVSPDRATSLGRRDHALLLTAVQTGMRVAELTGLTCPDADFGPAANLHCLGKGRKHRRVPLTRPTARLLRDWLRERRAVPSEPLFPNRTERPLSTDAVADLLTKHVAVAAERCPT